MITTSRVLNFAYRTAKGVAINVVVKNPHESLVDPVIKIGGQALLAQNVLGIAEGPNKNDLATTFEGASWIVVMKDQITLPN